MVQAVFQKKITDRRREKTPVRGVNHLVRGAITIENLEENVLHPNGVLY